MAVALSPTPQSASLLAKSQGPSKVPERGLAAILSASQRDPAAAKTAGLRDSFRALLEKFQGDKKPVASPPVNEKSLAVKTKASGAAEAAPKAKEIRKPDSKELSPGQTIEAWAAVLAHQPSLTPTVSVAKKSGSEAVELPVVDKAKTAKPAPKTSAEANLDAAAGSPLGLTPVDGKKDSATTKSDKAAEKPKITLVDRRTEAKDKALKVPGETGSDTPVSALAETKLSAKVHEAPSSEVKVVFQAVSGKSSSSFESTAAKPPVAPRDAAAFQQYLVERGYGQMVEQARIILKNDNHGEIRMTLYPETLGKIKVALNLNDNHLAGEIFVENQTVKEIFQQNMEQMLQAFRDDGFQSLSLQVSVGGQSGQKNPESRFTDPVTAQSYQRQGSAVAETAAAPGAKINAWSDRQVNLTV